MLKNKPIKALLLDLEGTLYFKGAPISGAKQALATLREMPLQLRFLTNTDSKTSRTIRDDLVSMGLAIEEHEIFTPATAALCFLRQNSDKRCHCLLSPDLATAFAPYSATEGQVDYVVIGDFRGSVSYETLNTAFRHIMAGAEIIALQKGRFFVRSDGYNLDTGAFVQLFEYASGKTARVLGKPSADFFRLGVEQLGCRLEEAAVVGDDVTTDIAGAKQVCALAVLVRTGKYNYQNLERAPTQPDLVIDSIGDLPSLLQDNLA